MLLAGCLGPVGKIRCPSSCRSEPRKEDLAFSFLIGARRRTDFLLTILGDDIAEQRHAGLAAGAWRTGSNNPLAAVAKRQDRGSVFGHGSFASDPLDGRWKTWQATTRRRISNKWRLRRDGAIPPSIGTSIGTLVCGSRKSRWRFRDCQQSGRCVVTTTSPPREVTPPERSGPRSGSAGPQRQRPRASVHPGDLRSR